jgi:hypothetical protein
MYFPAALAGVAKHSVAGNAKHNPGEPLHHARGKSMDHADCIDRHATDIGDIEAYITREGITPEAVKMLLAEANALCWRALAWSQELHERYGGAPLAPAARLPPPVVLAPEPELPLMSDPAPTNIPHTLHSQCWCGEQHDATELHWRG